MEAESRSRRVVRLVSLNINERDLSIALVMLKEFALQDAEVAAHYEIHLHQWMKNYARKGQPGTVEGLDLEAVVDALDPEHTDVLGLSMYTWSHTFMLAVAMRAKERNPQLVTLFGGSQAGGYGARLLEDYPFVDHVIRGEAEYAFRTFLRDRLTGELSGVPNLFYRAGDEVRSTVPVDPRAARRATFLPSISELPLPFRSQEYRDYLDNLDHTVTAQFETERGCPLSCAFCSWGNRLPIRRRSREDIEEGLTYLLAHPNVHAVYVVDANPFINNEKGLWLSEFVKRNRTGKPVYFEVNPEYIRDPRVIENLGSLQGDEMAFGVQSTSEVTLKRIKRKFHRDVYERNVRRLRELNPNANFKFSLILGLPSDSLATFLDSLDFVIALRPTDIYVHDLLILPGSEMYNDPASFGIVYDPRPPHRLVYNETFDGESYLHAKRIGYYTKLIHHFRELRDALYALAEHLSYRHVEVYERFIDALTAAGVDGLAGDPIETVSSEEFDWRVRGFAEVPDQAAALWAVFDAMAAQLRGEGSIAAK